MKTPSPLLLLALTVSLPSFAVEPAPAAGRCDAARLTKLAQGYIGAEDQKILKTETAEGAGARQVLDIGSAPSLCDATVWRYLVLKGPAGQSGVFWRDEGLKSAWAGDFTQQAKMLQTVDDVYKAVDAQGRDILAAGDAVVDAAVKLGVAARKDAAGPSALAAAGAAHAKFAGEKAYTVEAADGKAAVSPADLKASLSRLLADPPAPKAKAKAKAPAPEPVLGPGVLEFRKAVIGLASDLAVLSATNKLAASHGAVGMKADFVAGAGAMYAAAGKIAGKDGKAAYPDSVAASETAYQGALKYLTDPAISVAGDDAPHDGAALSRLDYALRNLIALRAAAVDQAVAAAKKRLAGRSVKETLAAVDRDAKPAKDAKGAAAAPKTDALGAEVLARLTGTKEYAELNAFYDNKSKADPAWAESEQGKAVAAQMKGMRDDAAATTIGKSGKGSPALQYTVGGQKVTDTGIIVADLKSDKEYREFIANAVATNIATDGKIQAFLAALRGQGGPGTAVAPPLAPDQQKTSGDLPAANPKPADAPLAPWAALAKATPGAGIFGWFSSKETAERYAAHEHETAAGIAEAASRARAQKERELNQQGAEADRRAKADEDRRVAEAQRKAKADEETLRQAPQDPDLAPAEAARRQKEAIAAREKAAADEAAAIRAKTAADKAAREAEAAKALKAAQEAAAKAKAESDEKMKALDETVDKAYTDGIAKSETELHGSYKVEGDARRNTAEKLSGYTGKFYHVERVDEFFAKTWEGDRLPAATASCKTKLNFKMPVGTGAGFKDPSADNVDGYCGVRDGLVAHLNSYRGKIGAPAPAPVPAK